MRADFPRGGHRVEHARDDLRRAGAAHLVGGLRLEQLGVREDDPELVVQAMEQQAEVGGSSTDVLELLDRRPAS